MKKLTALILAVLMMVSTMTVLAEDEGNYLWMGTNATFPPYEYLDGSEVVGIDPEIADAVAKYLGYDGCKVRDMEFESLINEVQLGKVDFVMAGMTVTEERLQQVNFSDSYATGVQVVIVKEDSAITSVDDLFAEGAMFNIGVQLSTTGDLYSTWDLEEEGKAVVHRFASGLEAVLALVNGKIDCVIIDNEPAKAYVEANEGLKILETEYIVENYAAAFSKENTELLAKFNEALKALTEDGTIPAIINTYIPTEEKAEEAAE